MKPIILQKFVFAVSAMLLLVNFAFADYTKLDADFWIRSATTGMLAVAMLILMNREKKSAS
jgi:hypothetical protein